MDYLINNKKIPFLKIDESSRFRSLVMVIFFLALLALLSVQFYRVQILQGEKWSRYAYNQHYQVVVEPFRRGTFWSNTSIKEKHLPIPQALARDIPKFHLYADPNAIPVPFRKHIVEKLVEILAHERPAPIESIDENVLMKELEKESRSRKLVLWLDSEERDAISVWWYPYAKKNKIPHNALFFVNDYQRSYPFGKLLGQVLHTIQEKKDEITHQGVPTGGLEMALNRYLSGSQGKRIIPRSLRHHLGSGEILRPAEDGADVYLTINHYLQAIVEEEIEKGIIKAKAKAGWAVMMDPYTGEILAIAQYPFFYPEKYQDYFNDPAKIPMTRVSAVMDSFEPGSTMKAITIAAAMAANKALQAQGKPPIFTPEEKIATSYGFFPGRKKPIVDTNLHYFLNMDLAIQKSSNIYMAKLVDRIISTMGGKWYREFLTKTFGFGVKTGIELPAESMGLLPEPGKHHANGLLEWSLATPYSLAMGYNLRATTVQMLRAYAVLANGGRLIRPTLIRKIIKEDSNGSKKVLEDHTSPKWFHETSQQVLDPQIANRVMQSVKYVMKRGGASARADIPGYTEAGKSSTTYKAIHGGYSDSRYFSTFIGMTPVPQPRFILLVAVDEPEKYFIAGVGHNQRGAICASPIFRAIAERSLEYLGVTPDDPYGYPSGDPRRNSDKADYSQEVKIIESLYKEWNHAPQSHG